MDLKTIKQYLRIDYDEDDNMLQSLMVAAESYLNDAIDDYDKKKNHKKYKERVDILISVMIQEWYDNRENAENKTLSYTTRSLITQLQVGGVDE